MKQLLSSALLVCVTAMPMLVQAGSTDSICTGFGPQSPRDITTAEGNNPVVFGRAPAPEQMNLCNIHLHEAAEHKGPGFSVYAGKGDKDGIGGGYHCALASKLSRAELKMPKGKNPSGLKPGDTIEFHWVFTSCDVAPGPGLGSCLSEACANPTLRVEAQVFTLVNDPKALNMFDLAYAGTMRDGKHQPKALPLADEGLVQYQGSTTGPKYTAATCSPLQVNWSVRNGCKKLDINSLNRWLQDNPFDEHGPHGVRELVIHPDLISDIF